MKRLLFLMFLIVCCLACTSCKETDTKILEKPNTVSGKILFREPLTGEMDKPSQGLVLLDPNTTAIAPTGTFGGNARFMGKSSKILVDVAGGKIELFDLTTKESVQVYQSEKSYSSSLAISYVDEKHFSVVEENRLMLVSIEDGEKRIIAEDVGNNIHSWSTDGKNVYYSVQPDGKKSQIVKLDIETGQKDYLFEGFSPKVSKDGRFIAYFPDGNRNQVIVKELNGEGQWKYIAPMVDFCLSPNGDYIASVEWWRGMELYMGCTVKIVDYKTGNTQTVVPKYANGQCIDIDWVE